MSLTNCDSECKHIRILRYSFVACCLHRLKIEKKIFFVVEENFILFILAQNLVFFFDCPKRWEILHNEEFLARWLSYPKSLQVPKTKNNVGHKMPITGLFSDCFLTETFFTVKQKRFHSEILMNILKLTRIFGATNNVYCGALLWKWDLKNRHQGC